MHLRSPSTGSEQSILRKSSLGQFLYDSNKSTTNSSLTNSFVRKDPSTPLRDLLAANALSLSNIFSNNIHTVTVFKKVASKDKLSPAKRSTEDTLRYGLSSLENSFVCAFNRKKKKTNDIQGEIFKLDKNDIRRLNRSQTMIFNEKRINTLTRARTKSISIEDLDDKIVNVEKIVSNINKESKRKLQEELQKKDMIIQIYQKLIAICRKEETVTESLKRNVRVLAKRQQIRSDSGESPLSRSLRSMSGRRLIFTGEPMTANGSFHSFLLQKPAQSTLNRTATVDRLDPKQNLRIEDNKEEGDSPLLAFLKRSITKKPVNNEGLNMGPRVRKVPSGNRKRKTVRVISVSEKYQTYSDLPTRPQSVVFKKDKSRSNLNTSANWNANYSSVDQTACSIYISNNNSGIVKNAALDGLMDRFESVYDSYQKANKRLIEDIKMYEMKIKEIQALKQRSRKLSLDVPNN